MSETHRGGNCSREYHSPVSLLKRRSSSSNREFFSSEGTEPKRKKENIKQKTRRIRAPESMRTFTVVWAVSRQRLRYGGHLNTGWPESPPPPHNTGVNKVLVEYFNNVLSQNPRPVDNLSQHARWCFTLFNVFIGRTFSRPHGGHDNGFRVSS